MSSSKGTFVPGGDLEIDGDLEVERTRSEIERVGAEIRALKEKVKAGESDDGTLKAKIETLLALKLSLPEGHPLRPEERKKGIQKDRKAREKKPAYRLLGPDELGTHRIQRKIHNVFSTMATGQANAEDDMDEDDENDDAGSQEDRKTSVQRPDNNTRVDDFKLNGSEFNIRKTGLDFQTSTIIATEKWDGTTLQADWRGIFKRRDLIARGDAKKFSANEAERYSLIQLDIHNVENRHVRKAIGKHLDILLNGIPQGITVYFEAVGPRIQARFREAFSDLGAMDEGGTIRVFDTSRNGHFLPFSETVRIAAELNLPTVHWFEYATQASPKTPKDLVDLLLHVRNNQISYTDTELLRPVPLEGYVFRCSQDPSKIAKLRVCDLEPLGFL